MIDDAVLEDAESYARGRLSDKRYAHTLRVAETAERLAKLHGLDSERARLAGLLHDTAREVGKEELLRVAEEDGLPVGDFERERPILLHGPVAAELAREDLGMEDGEVLDAVRAHTTGDPGMGPLALALFVADKIEPGREQPGVEDLRELARVSLHRAARAALEDSVSYNERRDRPAHPKSRQTLEWLRGSGDDRPGDV
ncbi:MAG: bis(5'-nucleosyl)-tetraphosphatase (symmetrical) YqeK [Actinomycetota bacterium]|nr:bis(5'-nucleosyl)-tetraphosphatase (symmetrical) YqeK [Actinomycetota bacterium]